MFTRMDQTIGELENMVARRQGFPDFDRSDLPSPWLLDLLFRLPNHATSAASMVPFEGAWITVWAKGPQPDAFSRSGLVMSSVVNPSGGKGTKSITAEFHNAFLEVMWSDPAICRSVRSPTQVSDPATVRGMASRGWSNSNGHRNAPRGRRDSSSCGVCQRQHAGHGSRSRCQKGARDRALAPSSAGDQTCNRSSSCSGFAV